MYNSIQSCIFVGQILLSEMNQLQQLHNSETTDNTYDHVLKYTGVFGGVQGLKMLVSLIRNMLTSKILGSVGVGLISVYNSISEFMVSCSNFGIPLNATRVSSELFEDGTEEQISHTVRVIRTWVVWTAVFATLLLFVFSPVISYFFFEHEWNHIAEVMLLCPMIVAFLIAEGECSILKGLRQLRSIAIIEPTVAVSTLLLTVPFYYFWNLKGIIIALNVSTIASCFVHLYYSVKLVPYSIKPFSKRYFSEGLPMARTGIPYVLAGIANSGLGMVIPALLLLHGTMSEVGYYRAGYALMVGYAGIVFVALEADYFPRLSSVNHDIEKMNRTINQQVDVCVLLIAPILIMMILCMPLVIPFLYKEDFMVIHDMTIVASFYTFFRAIMLPIAYTPLSKGDSKIFLCMEILSDIVMGLLMWWLYSMYNLIGAGMALSLAALYDVVVVALFYGGYYKCRISTNTWKLIIFQFLCLLVAVALCLLVDGWVARLSVVVVLIVSACRSWIVLKRNSSFVSSLLRKG